jgi:hypothetical protein
MTMKARRDNESLLLSKLDMTNPSIKKLQKKCRDARANTTRHRQKTTRLESASARSARQPRCQARHRMRRTRSCAIIRVAARCRSGMGCRCVKRNKPFECMKFNVQRDRANQDGGASLRSMRFTSLIYNYFFFLNLCTAGCPVYARQVHNGFPSRRSKAFFTTKDSPLKRNRQAAALKQ